VVEERRAICGKPSRDDELIFSSAEVPGHNVSFRTHGKERAEALHLFAAAGSVFATDRLVVPSDAPYTLFAATRNPHRN